MSAGTFIRTRYELSNGEICRIRIQPETLALEIGGTANAAPVGATTLGDVSATVSQSKRANGIKPRTVSVEFTGALPDGYSGDPISNLPVLTPGVFNGWALDDTGSYLGAPVRLVGKSGEQVR